MHKNIEYFRNIKINRGIRIKKIKSIKADMKTKYIINFNQMIKLKKIKSSAPKISKD